MNPSSRLHFPSIPSTHRYTIEHAAELPDRALITADVQTEGRGRLGRTWLSGPSESLLLSIVLKPAISAEAAALILHVLSIAAVRALERFGVDARIRWPNDVVVGEQKIAGCLAEAVLSRTHLDAVVASIGINLNQDREALAAIDRPATSLFAETGVRKNADEALELVWASFEPLYDRFLADGFPTLADEWRQRMSLAGTRVNVEAGDGVLEGLVEAFGDDGSMTIRDRDGRAHRLIAGEVVRVLNGS